MFYKVFEPRCKMKKGSKKKIAKQEFLTITLSLSRLLERMYDDKIKYKK